MHMEAIERAIRARGTLPFSGPELAAELNLCRQTIYRYIRLLNEAGHRIEGEPRMGFFARMKPQQEQPQCLTSSP